MKFRHVLLTAICIGSTPFHALAADPAKDAFPNKPIKLVVGFAAGGSADTVARIMAPRMAEIAAGKVTIAG